MLPSGHRVDPKMKILFSLYAMGRMTSIWGTDSVEFKPERWISERGRIKHEPSYKFFAFNAGPRTCLGKEVAFTQMKAVAATIIHNYHVQVVEGHHVAPNVSIILYMKHGLMVRVSKRWG
ncbi:Noroxomaritidine synthase [Vitis vinifera]|uniref:Noroxomaritidine synthase n=1 Tax=Vitis vinifera TaxID=29760 RepID=A0A438KK76_VITVI|nr:Noroxomaritidine synthase [Vitis vinifera]